MVENLGIKVYDRDEFNRIRWGCNIPKIHYDNILNCLRSLEIRRDFNKLSDLEKIYMVLENADTRVLIFYEEFVKDKDISYVSYEDWKSQLENNFKLGYKRQDFLKARSAA